jgi:UDP-N-acetylglucosamine--N-acetylmuramyl-(pentapeptide) pyrophosphoryl-undecaprenol N-acetylglucosamine transferase
MTILFTGGGTLGPVTPLLAVARRMRKMRPTLEFAWAGTQGGPERVVVERERMDFYPIPVAKIPRYVSWEWVRWPGRYRAAKKSARELLMRIKPSLVVGAGGFTQVPIMREASKMGIPCVIHQLDSVPTLSNKIVASRCALVTTSFLYPTSPFGQVNTEVVATPTRFAGVTVPDKEAAASRYLLKPDQPIVFVVGGGTGAQAINEAVWRMMGTTKGQSYPNIQIIHATGQGKGGGDVQRATGYMGKYLSYEFLDEQDMLFAYAAADVVVCRAGMGTLTDLATLKKAAIVIPIPDSHQEANTEAVKEGIVVVRQDASLGTQILAEIQRLMEDDQTRQKMGETLHRLLPTDDGTELARRYLAQTR